jgi:hypothetical protein
VTRIEADPTALTAAARALQDAAAVAGAVHRGATSLTQAALAAGSADLSGALASFRHTWAYGLGLVVDDATTLARMLGEAGEVYRRTDGAIASACRP